MVGAFEAHALDQRVGREPGPRSSIRRVVPIASAAVAGAPSRAGGEGKEDST